MKILVTGAAGFIGSNLCNSLARDGEEVYGIDNLYLGNWNNVDLGVKTYEIDVLDRAKLALAMDAIDPEYIVHLAAASSSPMFHEQERWGLDVNVMGFVNVMSLARKKHTRRVVYASSSSVYNGNPVPWSEMIYPEPKTFYEVSFKAREDIAYAYYMQYRFPSTGLRFFSVYGPNERHKGEYANNVTQFLWTIKEGKSPVIYGDGSQARDFIHVDDVVRCIKLAMVKANHQFVYNVGTGVSTSFRQIIDMINTALGTSVEPTYVQNPVPNYIAETRAQTDLARDALSFKSGIDIDKGILKLIEAYK